MKQEKMGEKRGKEKENEAEDSFQRSIANLTFNDFIDWTNHCDIEIQVYVDKMTMIRADRLSCRNRYALFDFYDYRFSLLNGPTIVI